MVWDKTLPVEGALAPTYNNIMRADKEAFEAAVNAYFYFVTGGTQTMQPRQGSARVYYQAAAPATRLDGDYFDSTDYGTPWIDSDNAKWYYLSSADGAGTDTWTLNSTEIIETAVAAAHSWAAKQTFSVSPGFTLGIAANNTYLTCRNAANNANINMIKINASDVPEILVGAILSASTAPTVDAGFSNKKYCDERLQTVSSQTGAVNTGTTVMPIDDSIPQKTEGDEYMTLAITPVSATSTLKIRVKVHAGHSVGGYIVAALFKDDDAGALAVGAVPLTGTNVLHPIVIDYSIASGSTDARTYKVRAGGSSSGTTTFNGVSAGRLFGGVASLSSITITEVR